MVVDFCLKLTPTYDVISLSVAFKKLSRIVSTNGIAEGRQSRAFSCGCPCRARQKSQYICRRE